MTKKSSEHNSDSKLPLNVLLSKPVHLMTDEDLVLYRQQLSLLRSVPQPNSPSGVRSQRMAAETISEPPIEDKRRQIFQKDNNEEIDPLTALAAGLSLPVVIGLVFAVPILILVYLLK